VSGLTVKEFDHKLKGGNFYSKGLCAWLKKHPRENRVILATWNSFNGHDQENKVMMIGRLVGNSFLGNRIHSVCRERGDRVCFAFHGENFHIAEWEDITEKFIEDYKAIGLCAIHKEAAHDFDVKVELELKKCSRCGAHYERRVELVEKVIWERVL